MKFSYDFLQSFFEEKLPTPEKLAELLMMHFFEVEEVEKVEGDYVLDIDILSSRAGDCFSHIGVAREISAITGLKYKVPDIKIKEKREVIGDKISVDVRGSCGRYTLRAVDEIEVKNSPVFIQKRLKSCGIKPINNIVDITNYVMLETGQPLHAFDAEKVGGSKIKVRYARKREKIVTLDEKRYELRDDILIIADEFSPIGIAGIKGGIVPEVDEKTKTIYLEAANFDAVTVRRGSHNLKLRTDASLRFEHGLSPEIAQIAIDRAVSMIIDIAGGKALKGMIDYYPRPQRQKTIEFEAEEVRRVLGVNIPLGEIERILRSLEFKVNRNQERFYLEIPYFRTDVVIKEDIVEEVGRIYGYEKIEAVIPKETITPSRGTDFFVKENACRDVWKGLGFSEAYSYSFINEEKASFFDRKKLIEVEKPVSLEFKYLRPTLLLNLAQAVRENKKNFEDVNIFEIGNVFCQKAEENQERRVLSVVSSKDNFYELKGKLNLFFKDFLSGDVLFVENDENEIFDQNCSGKIKYQNKEIGVFGYLKNEIVKKMKIEKETVFAEIEFEKIKDYYQEAKEYEPILKHPALVRDIAVLVPRETSYREVYEIVEKAGGKTLRGIHLFDFYEGKEIPEGTKSFAIRLKFQAKNKTLSSEEANDLQEKVISALDGVKSWKVRK